MLEIVAPILLAIFATVSGAMVMAGKADAKGKSGNVETHYVNSFKERKKLSAESAVSALARTYAGTKIAYKMLQEKPFSSEQVDALHSGMEEYAKAREHPFQYVGEGISKYILENKQKERLETVYENALETYTLLAGKAPPEYLRSLMGQKGEKLTESELGAIYKEFVRSGKVPEGIKIGVKHDLGVDQYGNAPRAAILKHHGGGEEGIEILVEDRLTKGGKKHALHHELEELYTREVNPYGTIKEGDIEGRVWAHYLGDIEGHREEMDAAMKYYEEIKRENPTLFNEILNGISKALNRRGAVGG